MRLTLKFQLLEQEHRENRPVSLGYSHLCLSLALRLHPARHAASYANDDESGKGLWAKELRSDGSPTSVALPAAFGGWAARLRGNRRISGTSSAFAPTNSSDNRDRDTHERIDSAGELADICCDCDKHPEHNSELEREWNSGRVRLRRNNHRGRSVHRSRRSALANHRNGHRHEPGGLDKIRNSATHDCKRHHDWYRAR